MSVYRNNSKKKLQAINNKRVFRCTDSNYLLSPIQFEDDEED